MHFFDTCVKELLRGGDFRKKCVWAQTKSGFGVAQQFSVRKYPKSHRPRSQSPLHFDIRNI